MRRLITNVISVVYSAVKFALLKIAHGKHLDIGGVERFSPNVIIEIDKKGKMSVGKKVRAHSGCIFKVRENAKMILEDECSFNYNCMIFCRNKIVIGKGVEFGPDVKIYDHDHDYKTEGGIKAGKFILGEVRIGANSWIGANTVILRGTILGENCVVAAGSVLKGEYPAGSVIIQKRVTKVIEDV